MSDLQYVKPLVEESTIDPSNPLPSFLEMMLVQSTAQSGQKAIRSGIEAAIDQLRHIESTHSSDSFRHRVASISCSILQRFRAEFELVVNYVIEKRCILSSANASVSESIYGLKRSRISRNGSISSISESDCVKSALFLVFGHYLKRRFDNWYEIERSSRVEQSNRNSELRERRCGREMLRRIFFYIYPYLHMTHRGTQLAYQFAYLIGQSVYFDPTHHALGLVVRRVTMEDMSARVNDQQSLSLSSLDEKVPPQVLTFLKKTAIIGVSSALLVGWSGRLSQTLRERRRRWMWNHDHQSDGEATGSGEPRRRDVIVPPPPLPAKHTDFEHKVEPPANKALCPICLENRVNPVASSSGNVFCYKCLFDFLREKGSKCPVTGYRCDPSQIIRIYEPGGNSK